VLNIDWDGTIPPASLSTTVCVDNPDRYRVELYFQASDTTWRRLDFYYDSSRISQERGFPELVWTGPHRSPGPGTFGVLNNVGTVWTGSRLADGKAYIEDTGYVDAANLVDSSGTVNFRIRTPRFYADGINSQATARRIFVSTSTTGTGTFNTTLNAWYEGDQIVNPTRPINATLQGTQSNDFDRSGQSFDVRITRDDAVAMPPINNITVVMKDVGELVKTNRR